MVKRLLALGSTLFLYASCAARPSEPPAPRDAAPVAVPAAAVADSPTVDAGATPAPEANPRDSLVAQLKKALPPGGAVDVGQEITVSHLPSRGDTFESIAGAYLDLTGYYTAPELARALRKSVPSLIVGTRVQIPNIVTHVARDPRSEKLGWPADKALRALFMTGPFAATKWVESLDRMTARGFNAVILDAKDYQGPVTYPTRSAIALEVGAANKPSIANLARTIRFAHWRGIRVSLRIPCFYDPRADRGAKNGRLSLKHAVTGKPVHIGWLDPTNDEVQTYVLELVREGIEAGADEINLDYVRFPVHVTSQFVRMPPPKDRSVAIRDFVRRVHAETKPAGVMLSLDLFGVTATGSRSDIDSLGQDIAVIGPEAEAIMPMVYPSHYDKGYNGWANPGDHPEIVGIGTKAAVAQLAKVGATTVVRAWLQAFAWRTSTYGARYIKDQAVSAEKNGGIGWAMWSPSCDYRVVFAAFPALPQRGERKDP